VKKKSRLFSRLALPAILLLSAATSYAKVLNVCDDITDPLTLDPQKQFSGKNHTICQQIFEGLIRFDSDGKIEPALAVSWERTDPLRVRFHLRKGVSFHNGEPFNSAAVKFSIERYLDPATGFPARPFIASIAGAEVVDPDTVDIITKYPDGILLNRLAGFVVIVPPDYIKEKGPEYFAANPVGTGAFIFKEWKKGEKVALSANPAYWMTGYPKVEGLVFNFIALDKQLTALFSGAVDLISHLPGPQTIKLMENPGTTVLKKASFYAVCANFNLKSGPLSKLAVRKALNHALNKQELIRYDLLGNGKPVAAFSVEGETGHNKALKPYKFDVKQAKDLLAGAGYHDGFTLKALVKVTAERTAKIIVSELKNVGVTLEFKLVSDAESITEFSRGGYDMAIGDVPDPIAHMYFRPALLLYSRSPHCLGGSPEFDALLDQLVGILDPAEGVKAAEKVDKYVYDNAMGLFTYQYVSLYGANKDLRFTPYVSGMPFFYGTYFLGK